jgi:hypothetical protein
MVSEFVAGVIKARPTPLPQAATQGEAMLGHIDRKVCAMRRRGRGIHLIPRGAGGGCGQACSAGTSGKPMPTNAGGAGSRP